ncbi:MAG: hypothetical protein ACI9JZ_000203 [Lentimonas sp.]|jgi:hypothetical protein
MKVSGRAYILHYVESLSCAVTGSWLSCDFGPRADAALSGAVS